MPTLLTDSSKGKGSSVHLWRFQNFSDIQENGKFCYLERIDEIKDN
jgi:hypothetical protein